MRFWQLQLQKTVFRGRKEGRSWGHKHPSTFYRLPGAAKSVAQTQTNTQESCIQLQKPKAKQSQRPLNLHRAKWSSISTSQKNTQRTTISGETTVDRAELSTHCFCRKGTVQLYHKHTQKTGQFSLVIWPYCAWTTTVFYVPQNCTQAYIIKAEHTHAQSRVRVWTLNSLSLVAMGNAISCNPPPP